MTRNIYALLVGIDNYPHPVAPLKGCVNDVTAVEEYLRGWVVAGVGFQLHLRSLKNQEATRQAIIDEFRQHLCQASSNDVALFYYSGHGSQEEAPPEFWHLEPDRLDETLVCWDSRTEGGWDLADKELAKLIAEVAAKEPHITIIMDCCHSGSGTRDPLQETAVRRVPTDKRQRPLDSFIISLEEAGSPPSRSLEGTPTGWSLPKGRHILLAACRDNEEAKEYYGDGKSRGAFCFFLMETLTRTNGSLTYRDLFKRANALVRSKVTAQSPQLEAINLRDLDQPFLGGAIAERTPYFTVSHHKDYGWVIDGGAVHGVPPRSGHETTQLALFPFDCTLEDLRHLASAIATAEVTEVLPQLSFVSISGSENLTTDMTFKAVVTSLPMPPLGVRLEGDGEGVQQIRQALLTAEPEQKPSLYVQEVTSKEVEFRVLARNGQYLITRPADDRPLVAQITNYTPQSAAQVVKRLEHIARWTNIAELSNLAISRIKPNAVNMEVYQQEEVITSPQIRFEYQLESNGKWQQPTFQVKLTNTSNEPLYCAVLDLTDRYAISAGFFEAGGVWLNPGEETWAMGKKPLYASVPQELWQQGITEFKDILKLIVSTAEFDATLLEQDKLDLPRTRSIGTNRREGQRKSTLNRLMKRVQTRDIGDRPEDEELYDDWVTSQVTITTVRPLNATLVPKEGNGVSLMAGVTLQPHPGLQAQARLTTVTQSTRDLGNLILPPILREDPNVTQPFQFTTSRGTDPGLSVLELLNVDAETIKTVTPQQPLKLLVDMPLKEGEHLLPIAYDGEFFLPLGSGQTKDNKTEIALLRLPEPVSEGRRSLSGAIRIFFQKVVSEKLGLNFPYPILAAADVSPDETVGYEGELENVKSQVASSERIVLYIHGIIGDTQSMIPSMQRASFEVDGQQKTLNELYDLVLTYDYESLNISIERHAIALKQRLAAVGLGLNHGKVLHIVAHSMGGLISRWFIEREGGNQIVSHLIMLGTPNAGSPWPTVQAWGTTALAIGLNSLSTVAWPVKVLGSLMAAIETIDITLDQMQPGSDFLKLLESSPDPGIPYTIIAGNTSIMPAVMESERLKRLMQKLFSEAVALPFFGQPNDIAATVHSIKSVSQGRSLQPQIQEVGCDHLVYFIHPEGLKALAKALIQAQGQVAQPATASIPTPHPVIIGSQNTNSQSADSQGSRSPKPEKPQWLIGLVALVIVTAATVGFFLWQSSQDTEPSNQDETSQSLPPYYLTTTEEL